MRLLFLIAFLCTSMYGQLDPSEWWAAASQEQKDFAEKCYEFGRQYGRGHSLTAIAWMESSLGKDTNHEEESYGAFGILRVTARQYRNAGSPAFIQDKGSDDGTADEIERGGRMALQIFEDNLGYFRRLGYSPREAYFWAYPRYCAGKNWRRFKRRGEVFNARVRFLKRRFNE